MNPIEDRSTPEWAAHEFWDGLVNADANSGLWLPRWSMRLNRAEILRDFATLDRPALAAKLETPPDASVRYAIIIEAGETIDGQLVEDRPAARYLTLKWVEALQFWAVAHYGPGIVQPDELP